MFLSWRKRPRPELTRIHVDDIDRGEMLARASNPFERHYYGHEGHTAYKWHHYLALFTIATSAVSVAGQCASWS